MDTIIKTKKLKVMKTITLISKKKKKR